jgi:hypothetical protein
MAETSTFDLHCIHRRQIFATFGGEFCGHFHPYWFLREEFMKKFAKAASKGFDPDKHLKKVGLANQTTMYKRETRYAADCHEFLTT